MNITSPVLTYKSGALWARDDNGNDVFCLEGLIYLFGKDSIPVDTRFRIVATDDGERNISLKRRWGRIYWSKPEFLPFRTLPGCGAMCYQIKEGMDTVNLRARIELVTPVVIRTPKLVRDYFGDAMLFDTAKTFLCYEGLVHVFGRDVVKVGETFSIVATEQPPTGYTLPSIEAHLCGRDWQWSFAGHTNRFTADANEFLTRHFGTTNRRIRLYLTIVKHNS